MNRLRMDDFCQKRADSARRIAAEKEKPYIEEEKRERRSSDDYGNRKKTEKWCDERSSKSDTRRNERGEVFSYTTMHRIFASAQKTEVVCCLLWDQVRYGKFCG